jgi:5-methylcytosine-specific restriction endonuclease McrA
VRTCFYCNTVLVKFVSNKRHRLNPPNGLTRDHLQPKDRGGAQLGNNIVDCCCNCNVDKARLTLAEYRLVVAFRNGIIKGVQFKFPGEQHEPNKTMETK